MRYFYFILIINDNRVQSFSQKIIWISYLSRPNHKGSFGLWRFNQNCIDFFKISMLFLSCFYLFELHFFLLFSILFSHKPFRLPNEVILKRAADFAEATIYPQPYLNQNGNSNRFVAKFCFYLCYYISRPLHEFLYGTLHVRAVRTRAAVGVTP